MKLASGSVLTQHHSNVRIVYIPLCPMFAKPFLKDFDLYIPIIPQFCLYKIPTLVGLTSMSLGDIPIICPLAHLPVSQQVIQIRRL